MKAYSIFSGCPSDGCILVYAETRNQAKSKAVGELFEWEYVDMNSRREPSFDKYASQVSGYIVEDNDELPEGAEPFYSDIEF